MFLNLFVIFINKFTNLLANGGEVLIWANWRINYQYTFFRCFMVNAQIVIIFLSKSKIILYPPTRNRYRDLCTFNYFTSPLRGFLPIPINFSFTLILILSGRALICLMALGVKRTLYIKQKFSNYNSFNNVSNSTHDFSSISSRALSASLLSR